MVRFGRRESEKAGRWKYERGRGKDEVGGVGIDMNFERGKWLGWMASDVNRNSRMRTVTTLWERARAR